MGSAESRSLTITSDGETPASVWRCGDPDNMIVMKADEVFQVLQARMSSVGIGPWTKQRLWQQKRSMLYCSNYHL